MHSQTSPVSFFLCLLLLSPVGEKKRDADTVSSLGLIFSTKYQNGAEIEPGEKRERAFSVQQITATLKEWRICRNTALGEEKKSQSFYGKLMLLL